MGRWTGTVKWGGLTEEYMRKHDEAIALIEKAEQVRSPESRVLAQAEEDAAVRTAATEAQAATYRDFVMNPSGSHNHEECPCMGCAAKRRTLARIKDRAAARERGENPGRF